MWPRKAVGESPEQRLQHLLGSVATRLLVKDALLAVAGGAAVTAIVLSSGSVFPSGPSLAAGLVVSGTVVVLVACRIFNSRWSIEAAARAAERACPDSRNAIVTAAELLADPHLSRSWIRARVFADAWRAAASRRVHRIVPLRGAAVAGLSAVAGCVFAWTHVARPPGPLDSSPPPQSAGSTPIESARGRIQATITPPAYTGRPVQSLIDPRRIEAIEGSRVRLTLEPRQSQWRARFGSRLLTLVEDRDALHLDLTLDESGYFVIEDPTRARTHLVPVQVTPDHAPAVRIDAPGGDLLVPDARPSIRVAATASDDYGLASLELRYTKVSGSGERFQFEEGTLPLEIVHHSGREWSADGLLAPGRLGLASGDALIYRVVGRDARGSGGIGSSDTFIVEIAAPGQVAVAGVELPPEQERYALSQQMIVLRIQRLRTRERGLPKDVLAGQAGDIAAEQRTVRSNFIFLLGGHVEDEVEEAEHEHEIQEGRLENTARREINQAIQHMSRTEQALVAVDMASALMQARAAVVALQRAFGRNRYILRSLPVRSRLDFSRRLTGELQGAADSTRPRADPELDARVRAARAILAELLTKGRAPDLHETLGLAEEALRVAPGDPTWQRISDALLAVRDALGARQAPDSALSDLMTLVLAESKRSAMPLAPAGSENPALRSAWAEERRRP